MSCNCRRCRERQNRENRENRENSENRCHNEQREEEVFTCPTKTVVNTRTNERVVRHIHPTEIIHVNRTIIRNEHFFPVTEREVFEVVEEEFDCGRDINNPNCRPSKGHEHCNRKDRCDR